MYRTCSWGVLNLIAAGIKQKSGEGKKAEILIGTLIKGGGGERERQT